VQKEAMQANQRFVQDIVPSATNAMLALAKAANSAAQALGGPAQPHKTGVEFIDKQVEKERASPEFAEYQKNQERIKKQQEEAAKKWRGESTAAPAAPPAAPAAPPAAPAAPPAAPAAPPAAPAAPKGGAAKAAPKGGAATAAAPTGGSDEPGGKPPADKPVPDKSASAGENVQMGQSVKIGNEIHKGGTVSWRTNNPGNVSYGGLSKQYGAIGAWKKLDGDEQQKTVGIAIMPSIEAGDQLKMGLWRRPKYIGKTIDQGVQQWTGTLGPGSGYAKDLARAAGVSLDTIIGELTDSQLKSMVTKQRAWEGFKPGQVIQAAQGGVFDGPKSGYAATLHGNEAVIPLKDGAVPVSMSQEFNMTATNLGELVNQMKYNMSVQDRMLAVLEEMRRSQSTTADNTGKMVSLAA
jgi:hypothetical protein